MSGGPRTSAGKAVAKMNALSHGMRSPAPVIPGEDAGEWERHHAGITDALAPAGAVEAALADRVALLLWRLGRVGRYETATVGASVADAERDYERGEEEKQRYTPGATHRHTPNTPGECRELIRDAAANVRLLRHLDTRRADEEIAAGEIATMLREAGKGAGHRTRVEDFDPDAVRYPALGEGQDWDDYETGTVGEVRECLAVLAVASGVPVGDLVGSAVLHYEIEGRGAKLRLEEGERELARMGARRMLLPAAELDKVQRYEAHLHRQMIQTLRELEAMGERRRGGATPLGRLDVSGTDAAG